MDDGARMRTAASIQVPEAIEIDADISSPTSAGISLADFMAALAPVTMGTQTMQQGLKDMQSRMTSPGPHRQSPRNPGYDQSR